MLTINSQFLRDMDACVGWQSRFNRAFPDGAEINYESAQVVVRRLARGEKSAHDIPVWYIGDQIFTTRGSAKYTQALEGAEELANAIRPKRDGRSGKVREADKPLFEKVELAMRVYELSVTANLCGDIRNVKAKFRKYCS